MDDIKKLLKNKHIAEYFKEHKIKYYDMSLGSIIRHMRLCAGMTQKDLSLYLNTARQLIQKYEYNKVKPKPERLRKIIDITDSLYEFTKLIQQFYI